MICSVTRARLLWLVGLLAAGAAAAIVFATYPNGGSGAGPDPTPPLPTELAGLKGPVNFVNPTLPPDPGEPVMYGPFRLIPFGYAKALRYEELVEVTESTGVELTRDPATVRQSSLFAEPSFLPAGYTLKELSGEGRGDAETEVFLRFERPGNEITISRTRITVTPLDVHLFSPDAGVAVQAGNVGRAPAVFIHPQPGNSVPLPVIVAFAKDGIYTIVTARGFTEQQPAPPLEEVIKIAESIL